MEVFSLIMAGGGGTRFWPLSRHAMPKQFLNISGNDTLINETIDRISSVISPSKTFVVTNKNQQAVLEQVLRDDIPKENVLYEPIGRNTAACIAYAALVIKKRYGDGILAVFPSDHYVTDRDGFVLVLKRCLEIAASTDSLVTIGIQPTFPATGYGYIRYDASVPVGDWAYRVEEFVEKPNFEKAKAYVRSGKYLWNSGMFVWKVSVILENFRRFLPRLYNKLAELEPYLDTPQEEEVLARIYPQLPDISIDYGILERSDDVVVVPGDFGWNDVGSWDALGAIFPPDEQGNIVRGQHVGLNTRDCVIYGNGRLIATINVKDLIIVETPDALLVCPKANAQDVKLIVERLKENPEWEKYL